MARRATADIAGRYPSSIPGCLAALDGVSEMSRFPLASLTDRLRFSDTVIATTEWAMITAIIAAAALAVVLGL